MLCHLHSTQFQSYVNHGISPNLMSSHKSGTHRACAFKCYCQTNLKSREHECARHSTMHIPVPVLQVHEDACVYSSCRHALLLTLFLIHTQHACQSYTTVISSSTAVAMAHTACVLTTALPHGRERKSEQVCTTQGAPPHTYLCLDADDAPGHIGELHPLSLCTGHSCIFLE